MFKRNRERGSADTVDADKTGTQSLRTKYRNLLPRQRYKPSDILLLAAKTPASLRLTIRIGSAEIEVTEGFDAKLLAKVCNALSLRSLTTKK